MLSDTISCQAAHVFMWITQLRTLALLYITENDEINEIMVAIAQWSVNATEINEIIVSISQWLMTVTETDEIMVSIALWSVNVTETHKIMVPIAQSLVNVTRTETHEIVMSISRWLS